MTIHRRPQWSGGRLRRAVRASALAGRVREGGFPRTTLVLTALTVVSGVAGLAYADLSARTGETANELTERQEQDRADRSSRRHAERVRFAVARPRSDGSDRVDVNVVFRLENRSVHEITSAHLVLEVDMRPLDGVADGWVMASTSRHLLSCTAWEFTVPGARSPGRLHPELTGARVYAGDPEVQFFQAGRVWQVRPGMDVIGEGHDGYPGRFAQAADVGQLKVIRSVPLAACGEAGG